MSIVPGKSIHEYRKLSGNPYAYVNGDGGFDSADQQTDAPTQEAQSPHGNARFSSQDPYAYIDGEGNLDPRFGSPAQKMSNHIGAEELREGAPPDSRFSDQQIERIVVRLQRRLWANRHALLNTTADPDPLDLLDPTIAIEQLGYRVDLEESLGQFSEGVETFEVAGILNRDDGEVRLSRQFKPEYRKFTAAHELAHLVLHSGTGLHRDRPVDRLDDSSRRSYTERQADVFATYFLMPRKQVVAAFKRIFLMAPFVVNQDTLSALSLADRELIDRAKSQRDRSMVLAECEFFNGEYLVSLARLFGVSQTAAAIRLEELDLVG